LTQPNFHLKKGFDCVNDTITNLEEQSDEDCELIREQWLEKPPQVIHLFEQGYASQFKEPLRREAFLIHRDCFSVFSHLLQLEGKKINVMTAVWFVAQSLRPLWNPRWERPDKLHWRRRAIFHDAIPGNHFSLLCSLLKAQAPEAASLFDRIHSLPNELRLAIATYFEDSPLQDSLLIMQQLSEFLHLFPVTSTSVITEINPFRDIYLKTARLAGGNHLVQIQNTPIPGGERLPAPPRSYRCCCRIR
jgi:hypothetical protein